MCLTSNIFEVRHREKEKICSALASSWPAAQSTLAAQTIAIADVTQLIGSTVMQVYGPERLPHSLELIYSKASDVSFSIYVYKPDISCDEIRSRTYLPSTFFHVLFLFQDQVNKTLTKSKITWCSAHCWIKSTGSYFTQAQLTFLLEEEVWAVTHAFGLVYWGLSLT